MTEASKFEGALRRQKQRAKSIMIEQIAFDFSGTLVSYNVKQDSLAKKIEKALGIGIKKGVFFYEKLKFLEQLYGDKLLKILEEDEMAAIKSMRLLAGISVLEELSERYKLAIISNNTRKMIELALEKLGISQYFDEIVAFEDAHPKPSVEPYLVLSERTGVKPQNILGVGNTNADALSSKASGGFFISVGRETILADFTVSNVNEIATVDFDSLRELDVRPIEVFGSRKNTVFRTEDGFVVKEHSNPEKALFETMIHGRLYLKKISVPRPIRLVGNRIVMEYINGKTLMDAICEVDTSVLKSVAEILIKSFIDTGLTNTDPTLKNFLVVNGRVYMVDFEDFAPGSLEETLGVLIANVFSVKGVSKEEVKRISSILVRSFKELVNIESSYVEYAIKTLERKIKGLGRRDLVDALINLNEAKRELDALSNAINIGYNKL